MVGNSSMSFAFSSLSKVPLNNPWGYMSIGQSLPKTGYITSDGKDLSEVFLGREEKAVSAGTADIATNVAISGIIGSRKVSLNGSPVQVSLISSGDVKTWTVPSDGILHTTNLASDANDYVKHNGVLLSSYHASTGEEYKIDRPVLPIPVYKDDTFTVKGRTTRHKAALEGWFFPYKTIEVTENE